jgi:hypothetical protein
MAETQQTDGTIKRKDATLQHKDPEKEDDIQTGEQIPH